MFGTLQKWWLVPFHQDDADIVGWPGGLSSSAGDGVVRCGGVGVGAFFVCGKKIKKSEIFFFAKHVHFTSEEHQINCLCKSLCLCAQVNTSKVNPHGQVFWTSSKTFNNFLNRYYDLHFHFIEPVV